MFSTICLLTRPSSGLHGLISLQVGLFLKFGLWSLSAMKDSLFAVVSILSLRSSLSAMVLSSAVIFDTASSFNFLYSFCMHFVRSSSYCSSVHWAKRTENSTCTCGFWVSMVRYATSQVYIVSITL